MFGAKSPQIDVGNGEWILDGSRKRLVNKKHFTYAQNLMYDRQYIHKGLRPDLTNYESNIFHAKLRMAHALKGQFLNNANKELARHRLYGNLTDYDANKVPVP